MKQVKGFFPEKNDGYKEIAEKFLSSSFNARQLGRSVRVWEAMNNDDKCTKYLCLAGALIPGGLKPTIMKIIEYRLTDCLIVTGAMLTHDLIEEFGTHHYESTGEIDRELRKKQLNRIYDTVLPNEGYLKFEENMQKIMEKLPQEKMSCVRFIREVGKHVSDNCITGLATKMEIPVFCPSVADSILGFQAWMYSQDNKLKINPMLDIKEILDRTFEEEKHGAVICGGGIPKHFIAMAAQVANKPLSYAVQITLDRPEHGGVSGARLGEAVSWNKVAPDALTANVVCDVTIALPFLVGALL